VGRLGSAALGRILGELDFYFPECGPPSHGGESRDESSQRAFLDKLDLCGDGAAAAVSDGDGGAVERTVCGRALQVRLCEGGGRGRFLTLRPCARQSMLKRTHEESASF